MGQKDKKTIAADSHLVAKALVEAMTRYNQQLDSKKELTRAEKRHAATLSSLSKVVNPK